MLKPIVLILSSMALAAAIPVRAEDNGAGVMTDAEIAMIVLVADTVDVNYGKLAAQKTTHKGVREFAETMIRDHTAVNDKATALAMKLGLTPQGEGGGFRAIVNSGPDGVQEVPHMHMHLVGGRPMGRMLSRSA